LRCLSGFFVKELVLTQANPGHSPQTQKPYLLGVILCCTLALGGGIIFYFQQNKPETSPANAASIKPVSVANNQPEQPSSRQQNIEAVVDTRTSYENKVAALEKITGEPTPAQKQTLITIINDTKQHATVRNNAIELLAHCQNKSPELGRDLVKIFKDETEGHVFRDYAVQHMSTVYEFADNKEELEQTLFAAAEMPSDQHTNFGGTALLSLQDIAKVNPRVSKRLEFIARQTVLSEKPDAEKAVTSLNISREAGDKALLAKARQLAQSSSALTRLRMSACGYLGELGEKADVALLEKLAQSKDSRIKRAAAYNLKMLTQRMGS